MKTFIIEKVRTERKLLEIDRHLLAHIQNIAFAGLIVLAMLIGCTFINPLIVFSLAGLVVAGTSFYKSYKYFEAMDYEMGNDLLDHQSLTNFKEEYER